MKLCIWLVKPVFVGLVWSEDWSDCFIYLQINKSSVFGQCCSFAETYQLIILRSWTNLGNISDLLSSLLVLGDCDMP